MWVQTKLNADGDVHAGREVELFELVHCAGGGVNDVQQTLVRADFKLLHGLLIDVRGAVNSKFFDACWQRDGTGHFGSGALRRFHDVGGAFIEHAVIVCPQADSDSLIVHDVIPLTSD